MAGFFFRFTLTAAVIATVGNAFAAGTKREVKKPPSKTPTPSKATTSKPASPVKSELPKEVLEPIKRIFIEPGTISLSGPRATQQILVTAEYNDGSLREITTRATLTTEGAAFTLQDGLVKPQADGEGKLVARFQRHSVTAPVQVKNAGAVAVYSFQSDIVPILSRAGCNVSNCHGSPVGKGGFKLSLFGYEPDDDFKAVVKDRDGKLVNKTEVEASLFLQKPTMAQPHKGGLRFEKNSFEYQVIAGWLKSGAPLGEETAPKLVGMEILPDHRVMASPKQTQQLLVLAKFSDGSVEDVTRKATYSSNDDSIGSVELNGKVTAGNNGEAAIMVRYTNQVGVGRIGVAVGREIADNEFPKSDNLVDKAVFAKLKRLRIAPSQLTDDVTFLRRAYLDVVGMLPPAGEIRSFAIDLDPTKREKLVDKLLAMPESADHWVLRWGDLFRINQRYMLTQTVSFHGWVRDSFVQNKPLDQFAREIVTASGSPSSQPATSFWSQRLFPSAEDRSAAISQLFLGVRIECARCHNHPFERWTQGDFYGFTAFFTRLRAAGPNQNQDVVVQVLPAGEARHPKTNQIIPPTFLGGGKAENLPVDRREALANWMLTRENPFFARAMVNRIWKHYFGRGIVEPVDDFRITNPATNDELLNALARELADHNFDLKHVSKLILTSKTYQLSTLTNDTNEKDEKYFSHYSPKRLLAECLLDAVCQATGVTEVYPNAPAGTRAMQLATPQGNRAGRGSSYFLDVFGTSRRTTICDRSDEGSVPQALNLINGITTNVKISAQNGRLAKLLGEGMSNEKVIEELYLATVSRVPTSEELSKHAEYVGKGNRQERLEDLFWALLGSKEFLYNH